MRKIIEEKTVYTYNELPEKAKEKVRKMFLEWREAFEFEDICKDILHYTYGLCDFDVQFSLSYSQGDGLNVYGTLALWEAEKLVGEQFSEKEWKRLKFYSEVVYEPIIIPENPKYCYDYSNRIDIYCDWIGELEAEHIRKIDYDLIERFDLAIKKAFHDINKKLEDYGYDFFYNISESEIIDTCDANNYEFLENGTLY